jgi:hypothetical protein
MTGAYSFVCQYASTDTLRARLQQIAWEWRIGDSHWYGDYLAAIPFPGVRIRIVDFPERTDNGWKYESDIRLTKECETPMAEVDAAYRSVLAQLPAYEINEIEQFD